jgi:hypothetical protein
MKKLLSGMKFMRHEFQMDELLLLLVMASFMLLAQYPRCGPFGLGSRCAARALIQTARFPSAVRCFL